MILALVAYVLLVLVVVEPHGAVGGPVAAGGGAGVGGGAGAGGAAPQRIPRFEHQNRVSRKRRFLCMTPTDKLRVDELYELLGDVATQITSHAGNQLVIHQLSQLADQVLDEIESVTTILVSSLPQRAPRPMNERRRMLTLDGVMAMFRNHEGEFHNVYGLKLAEFNQLLSLNFLGTADFHIHKRGWLSRAGALLLLFGRLRSGCAALEAFSDYWGVDAAFICAFFGLILDRVEALHGHRLSFSQLRARFSHRLEAYRGAMRYIYSKGMGRLPTLLNLPDYFVDCCFVLDGMRVHICRPGEDQDVFYNGYVGYHNIAFIGMCAPDGMMVALSASDAGHVNDPQMINLNGITVDLSVAAAPGHTPAKSLADAAFGNSAFIAPLPRQNQQVHAQLGPARLAALSGARVMIEWCFGEIRMTYPYIELLLRMKVRHTRPILTLRTAALLRNVLRAMRGSNASLYANLAPMSVEEYLA